MKRTEDNRGQLQTIRPMSSHRCRFDADRLAPEFHIDLPGVLDLSPRPTANYRKLRRNVIQNKIAQEINRLNREVDMYRPGLPEIIGN